MTRPDEAARAGIATDASPIGPAPRQPTGSLLSGGMFLAAGSMLANALSFALTVVLARLYGHDDYGALAALLGLALVAAVPATGLQYVIARRVAGAEVPGRVHDRTGLIAAARLGTGLAVTLAVASPAVAAFLHVPVPAVLWIAVMELAYSVNAAQTGSLLGHAQYGRFAVSQILLAGYRLVGALIAGTAGLGVTGATGAFALGTYGAVLAVVALTGRRTWTLRISGGPGLVRETARAATAIAGITALMNVDILLARHFLDASDSGIYALGSLFAKASVWGAQFVPQLLFPRLARAPRRQRLLLAGACTVVLIGAVICLAAAVLGPAILRFVSGDADPDAAARLAVPFALLGIGWALCYLTLLAAVAAQRAWPIRILWAVLLAETLAVVIALHDTSVQILTTCLVGTLLITLLASTALMVGHRPATQPPAGT